MRNLLTIPLLLFTLSFVSYANASLSHVQFSEYSQDMERKTKIEVAHEIQRIKNLLEDKTAKGTISRPVALVLATTLSTLTYLLITGSVTHYFMYYNDNGSPNAGSTPSPSATNPVVPEVPEVPKKEDSTPPTPATDLIVPEDSDPSDVAVIPSNVTPTAPALDSNNLPINANSGDQGDVVQPTLPNDPDAVGDSTKPDVTITDKPDNTTAGRILHYRHILAGIMALSLPSSAAVGVALGLGGDDVKVPFKDILMMSTTRTLSSFTVWGSSSLASWFLFEKLQGAVNYRLRGTYMGAISLALLPYQIYGLYSDLVTKRNELKNEVLDLQDMLDTAKAAYFKFELEEHSRLHNQSEIPIDQSRSF